VLKAEEEERKKAKERNVGIAEVLLEDAKYTLELDKKK